MKTIYLGGGCFWCLEVIFSSLKGITESIPGYMGGTLPNPSYESVCSGESGHAEVVKVTYDESIISLDDILDIFFVTHDPTSLNRQGNDIGTQYRSVIFYTDGTEAPNFHDSGTGDIPGVLQHAIDKAQAKLSEGKRIVTEVVSATEFYPAEEYHYNYYLQNKQAPYCQLVISPKLEKLQKQFGDKVKK